MRPPSFLLALMFLLAGCISDAPPDGAGAEERPDDDGVSERRQSEEAKVYQEQVPITLGPADVPDAAINAANQNCVYLKFDDKYEIVAGSFMLEWQPQSQAAERLRFYFKQFGREALYVEGNSPLTLEIDADDVDPTEEFLSLWGQSFLADGQLTALQPARIHVELEYSSASSPYIRDIDSCGYVV